MSSDLWNIMVRAGAIESAQVRSTVSGMPSGPGAL